MDVNSTYEKMEVAFSIRTRPEATIHCQCFLRFTGKGRTARGVQHLRQNEQENNAGDEGGREKVPLEQAPPTPLSPRLLVFLSCRPRKKPKMPKNPKMSLSVLSAQPPTCLPCFAKHRFRSSKRCERLTNQNRPCEKRGIPSGDIETCFLPPGMVSTEFAPPQLLTTFIWKNDFLTKIFLNLSLPLFRTRLLFLETYQLTRLLMYRVRVFIVVLIRFEFLLTLPYQFAETKSLTTSACACADSSKERKAATLRIDSNSNTT